MNLSLLRFSTSIRLLALAGLGLLAGCYERVVSERPFAGMSSRRDVATAPDYTHQQQAFEDRYREQTEPKFDPLGDFGRWVGGLFGGGSEKPAKGGGPQATTNAPSGTTNAPAPVPAPASPASGSSGSSPSPFDTTP